MENIIIEILESSRAAVVACFYCLHDVKFVVVLIQKAQADNLQVQWSIEDASNANNAPSI